MKKLFLKIVSIFTIIFILLGFSEKSTYAADNANLITYNTIYYDKTLQEVIDIQMSKNPQTDSSGKWGTAARKEVENYLYPNHFLQFIPQKGTNSISSIKITADILNVREGPGTSYKILTTVKNNEVYIVLDSSNGWYKINANGNIGWVSGGFVKHTNSVPKEMYQFLVLSGSSGISLSDLNNELKGKGILEGKGQAFLDAGKKHNINEVYLLSHALLETGHGKSKLANGIRVETVDEAPVEPKTVYNMYGIGAKDEDPNRLGAEYAYKQGWFTPEEAIIGGAKWIVDNYINYSTYKQNTLYKMRWNPINPGVHQYATDIGWAYKQTRSLFVEICDRISTVKLSFEIPVYKNSNSSSYWWAYNNRWYLIGSDGLMTTGWQKVNGKWYYMDSNGVMQTGWQKYNGKWYYLASSGAMETGWIKASGKWYYLDSNGVMQTGWQKINGKWYYLDNNGVMKTGWIKLDNKWYYFDSTGAMQTGFQTINGKMYYMDSSGVMQTGWQTINGKTYYMNSSGVVQQKTIIDGYKLGEDGARVTGWEKINNDWHYYLDGMIQTGWQKINGKWYFMDSNGVMQTGWQKIDGEWYYMASSGAMQTGWVQVGSKQYYMNSSGVMQTGWQKIAGKWYYLAPSGAMETGWIKDCDKRYYLDGTGVMQTGWQKINGEWYYMDSSGAMQTGWVQVGSKRYYMNSSGVMQTGWQKIDGEWYYMDGNGALQTGWVKVSDKWYYMDSTGVMQTGWIKVGSKWYYLYSNGSMAENTTIDGYRLGSDGAWIK